MPVLALFLKSRITPGLIVSLSVVQLAGVAIAVVERLRVFPLVDLSIFSAVAVPGFVVALVLMTGISAIPDFEAVAWPRPTVYTIALMSAGVLCSLSITELARVGVLGTEYNGYDILRNYLVYLVLGLVPAASGRWEVGPVLVALTTVAALGLFGITRSLVPFGPLVWPAGRPLPAVLAVLSVVAVSAVVVVAERPGLGWPLWMPRRGSGQEPG